MAAAVLDGLDGRLARALKGTSRFGAELDSLADFVDFGVAPALLLYFWSLHEIKNFGWFAALAFAIACALRLARFNVMSEDPTRPAWHGDFFVGMPSPAGAVTVLLPLYLHLSVLELPASRAFAPFYILYVLMIAFLMASRIPHFSGKRVGRVPRDLIIPLLFGGGVLLLLLAIYPMEILIALSLAYLALIPLACAAITPWRGRRKPRSPHPREFATVARRGGRRHSGPRTTKTGGPGASANRPAPRTRKRCGSEFWAPGPAAASRNGTAIAPTVAPCALASLALARARNPRWR
jgi:CDP-diacylglycerol--serine O-phosphatidyltransferase